MNIEQTAPPTKSTPSPYHPPAMCFCFHKWTSEHVPEIYPVCDEYVRWRNNDARCEKCEHDEACHR